MLHLFIFLRMLRQESQAFFNFCMFTENRAENLVQIVPAATKVCFPKTASGNISANGVHDGLTDNRCSFRNGRVPDRARPSPVPHSHCPADDRAPLNAKGEQDQNLFFFHKSLSQNTVTFFE